jgi:hypothetical protein
MTRDLAGHRTQSPRGNTRTRSLVDLVENRLEERTVEVPISLADAGGRQPALRRDNLFLGDVRTTGHEIRR